ncbi:methyltransferase domain-containing protein [Fodinicola feengrottensis]|uniref:methyltransferase domain-containing protein n=1 Tax=Fodinicola feengrottensis TaxID=435914 RepID=UPI002441527D|nr:methyltransferase domain-containing protein [Fodinicola feengrottensis]
MRLLARTVRGLESLASAEIHQEGIGRTESVRHREVVFRPSGTDPLLLRTVDDVMVLAAEVTGIGKSTVDLRRFSAMAVDVAAVLAVRKRFGGIDVTSDVDVSASVVGLRRFGRYDVEDAVGARLADLLGCRYHSRRGGRRPPAGSVTWRVSLEGQVARVAVRIADRPLHRRSYKIGSVPGTLHPPVAAAMARLADIQERHLVLDPCCGAGTTLLEATGRRLGFDLQPSVVRVAVGNAGGAVSLGVADAAALPIAGGSVDRVLVNPPWGVAVPVTIGPEPLWREIRRVLRPDGRAVALLPDLTAGPRTGFLLRRQIDLRLHGRLAVLAVFDGGTAV